MLKKICRLFLGLVVCASSACVTPTHASSANPEVVLVHIQAAGGTPQEEMVSIYNNTPNDVIITDWCVKNKTNKTFACFETSDPALAYVLPSYSFAVVASSVFITANNLASNQVTVVSSITNAGSGSMVSANDILSLVDASGEVVDSYAWTTAAPAGKVATRTKSLIFPNTYEVGDSVLSWSNQSLLEIPFPRAEVRGQGYLPPEVNPDGSNEPPHNEHPGASLVHPYLTELLPNPKGVDMGNEFIEIFNPNQSEPINLADYTLRVGPQLEKSYSFPANTILMPLEYRAFSNVEIKYSLLNSTSSVQLTYKDEVIGELVTYVSPKDGQAWALFDSSWGYTTNPSPGAVNTIPSGATKDEIQKSLVTSVLKPCAANQYRSPETNRCRNLTSSESSTLKPCTAGQYRSLETNRCRNIASSSTLAACKVGQERNPETNRCRNIVKMSEANHGIKGAATEESYVGTSWYWWLGIGGVIALVVTYAVWEWRQELQKGFAVLKLKFARLKP